MSTRGSAPYADFDGEEKRRSEMMKVRMCCYWYVPELGYCVNPRVPARCCLKEGYCEKCPKHMDLREPENFQLLKKLSPNCLQVRLLERWFQEK